MSDKDQKSDLATSSPVPSSGPRRFRYPDPFAEREAGKYARPIPSRELILKVFQERGVPMSLEEIAELLGVVDPEDCESLRRRLNAMERDGQLVRNRNDRFCVVNAKDLISGRVIGHPDGYGFVRPDDGSPDLFVSPRDMRALMHDDRVVVSVRGIDRRGRREAALVQVLERNTWRTVGRLFIERDIAYVVPDNKRISQEILIPENALGGAKHGQIVVVEILEQPTVYREAIGRIAEVLGDHMAPGMEIEVAIRNYDLPCEWPEEVAAAVAGLVPAVPDAAKEGRVDLRALPLVTIDGEDARDFDDAVFCRRTAKGWKLYVAIADVAHYVEHDTVLDREAYRRGNSVYFPERVLPMLPELLSNGLCSLNPLEDRLCMVCEMIVDEEGRIARSRFYEGVMRSHARLTYTEVARMLVDKDPDLRRRHKALVPHLENLHAVYRCLRRARDARGAIDFETQEARIVFGPGRKIERILPLVRNDAHRLIEECMIAANMAAARFLAHAKVPHLVRIHEGPTAERLADLRTFLGELGLHLGGGDRPSPKDYAELLEKVRGRPDEHLIQTVMLRSLAQAVYGPEKKGHFGLAADAYTHFTSPIRRYPDLLVHRAVKHVLRKAKPTEFRYTHNDLVLAGEHCSTTERRADEATRDVMSWLKCEFMMGKVGEEFDAIISAVTPFGFFAELSEVYIEGLVHISNLDKDFFHYDPIGHRLVGQRSGVRYRLGDRVRVKVVRVDLDERKIDLELVRKTATAPTARRRGGRRRARK